jgi:hypothetical protein
MSATRATGTVMTTSSVAEALSSGSTVLLVLERLGKLGGISPVGVGGAVATDGELVQQRALACPGHPGDQHALHVPAPSGIIL